MTQPILAGICVKKNRLRMQGNKVYLKDKQEFEIELFNPTSDNRLAKIFLNGQEISNSGLVIRPGQRIYLERYLNEPKKFRFDTYFIDGSPESLKAAASNGNVEIYFYDEIVKAPEPILPDLSTITRRDDTDWAEGYDFDTALGALHDFSDHRSTVSDSAGGTFTFHCYGGGTGFSGASAGDVTVTSGSGTVTSAIGATGTPLTTNASLTSSDPDVKLGGTLLHDTSIRSTEKRLLKRKSTGGGQKVNSILRSSRTETGRVEKGGTSDQKFVDFVGTFEDFWSASVFFNILPMSQKPVEAKDLGAYCTNCGTKNKGNRYKYCPSCGNKY